MKRILLVVYLVLAFFSILHVSNAATAEDIFKRTSASIVLIRDIESHGSGVVLSSKGTILTSYHVVNTPLPLEVSAEVIKGGRRATMIFKEVEVVGVHKEYDLAMIKVKLPLGVSMKPLAKATSTLATGAACFVIGNPGGSEGQALRNSISTGIISAKEREIEGKKYIQTTAAINPGNSGGALVDRFGKLVGIIAFIITDTEGIGFAIPIKGIPSSSFVKPSDRKGDVKKGLEYEKIGEQWYIQAQRSTGEAREFALAMAYMAYRLCLTELPNSSAPYNNLGNIYVDTGEHKTAKIFFEKALELEGGSSPLYLKMLGICEQACGDVKKANVLWKKGLLCTKEDDIRGECAENLAISAINDENYAAASYLVKWADSLGKARGSRAPVRIKIMQDSVNHLSDKQYKYISAKTTGFSFEGMVSFRKGSVKAVSSTAAVAPKAEAPKAVVVPKKIFETALKGAPDPGFEGLKKKMPETPTDCRPAYGGVYLIMKFPEMKKLGVFNIAHCKFEKYIPLPASNCIYAAGGTLLIVFDPNQKLFQVYDLVAFKRTATKMSRIQGYLTDINMGLFEPKKAFVSWADGATALDRRNYGLLEIPSMQITPFKTKERFRNTSYRDQIHVRVDERLTRFVSWCTSHSPSGFICGSISGLDVTQNYEHSSFGSLSLIPDKSRIISSRGKILDTKGGTRHDFKESGSVLFAVTGANLLLKVTGDKVSIIDAINLAERGTLTLPFKMKSSTWNKDDFTTDRLVFASAHLNRAVFIDNATQQIVVHKLSSSAVDTKILAEELQGVKAGTSWTRKLDYPAGTKILVEDAPSGVKLDSKSMTLYWKIPSVTEAGSHMILLSVTEPGKEEVYKRVSVTIR
ncbi:trypsin-like peptidase domain-containing protein [Verrucomicrobiota bacterium]